LLPVSNHERKSFYGELWVERSLNALLMYGSLCSDLKCSNGSEIQGLDLSFRGLVIPLKIGIL